MPRRQELTVRDPRTGDAFGGTEIEFAGEVRERAGQNGSRWHALCALERELATEGHAREDGRADPRADHERRVRRGSQAGVMRCFLLLVAALAGSAYWASSPTTATVAAANCSTPTRPSFLPSDMTV